MSQTRPQPLYRGQAVCLNNLSFDFTPPPGVQLDEEGECLFRIGVIVTAVFRVRPVSVKYWKKGTKNLIFRVELSASASAEVPRTCLFRLATYEKEISGINSKSEVDTMLYILANPNLHIPIPKLYAYATHHSPLDLSFQIIEYVTAGAPLLNVLLTLGPVERRRLIEDYARIVYELSRCRFSSIGALERMENGTFGVVGISANRSHVEARRQLRTASDMARPFHSINKWLTTVETENLMLVEKFPHLLRMGNEPDDATRARLQGYSAVITGMLHIIPRVASFPEGSEQAQLSLFTCLYHTDMSPANILVVPSGPDAGRIASIIDWEEAGVFPIWRLVHSPGWFTAGQSTQQGLENKAIFENAIRNLTGEGMLTKALLPKYDLLRKVMFAASCPYWVEQYRRACIQDFRTLPLPANPPSRIPVRENQSGYSTDYVSSTRKEKGKIRGIFGKSRSH